MAEVIKPLILRETDVLNVVHTLVKYDVRHNEHNTEHIQILLSSAGGSRF